MSKLIIIMILVIFTPGLWAQVNPDYVDEDYELTPLIRRPGLPLINFDTGNKLLLRDIYPEEYINEYDLARDIRWVNRNDSEFVAVWDSLGDSILALTEDFSGIKWVEPEIEISLVKYLRVDLMYKPAAIPLEGLRMEHYIEAAPTGLHRFLNLIVLIAGRNLMQSEMPDYTGQPIANHPLMNKSAYRFDVLALTLGITVAENIIPLDSLENILKTEHWQRHHPEWELYQNHFRFAWMPTLEDPLINFILREPYDSPLVSMTRPPRPVADVKENKTADEPIKLSAGPGRLGFSVTKLPNGLLEVADVDTLGLAHANGLMVGDRIKRVNGEAVYNARDLMAKILDKIDTEGVYMIIIREGEEVGLLFFPDAGEY